MLKAAITGTYMYSEAVCKTSVQLEYLTHDVWSDVHVESSV